MLNVLLSALPVLNSEATLASSNTVQPKGVGCTYGYQPQPLSICGILGK